MNGLPGDGATVVATAEDPVWHVPEPIGVDPGIPLPPDSIGYRIKRKLLGPPLHSDEMEHQRLGKPTALAVFASDNLSSSAYATEEILHVLIPLVGVAAFSLVVPITLAMIVVLGFLILSYRETIKEYPSAGGAYLVTRDNFGSIPAQVAGASLLTDYILTVAVSASAGTAALVSAFEGLAPMRVPIAIFFVALIAFGNLRGVKESGKVFAVPTYFFIVNMGLLLGIGLVKYLDGRPARRGRRRRGERALRHARPTRCSTAPGCSACSTPSPPAAPRSPAWRPSPTACPPSRSPSGGTPARRSWSWAPASASCSSACRPSPRPSTWRPSSTGTPTVIAQVGEAVFGGGALGDVLFYSLQAGTMLILVMAANTGFADFPRLASFQAGDSFLPRQMTKRGHRLVYSNGVLVLAGAAALLIVGHGRRGDGAHPALRHRRVHRASPCRRPGW